MERLTAKNNDKIKAAISVRDSSKTRRQTGLFFLEGARLCADATGNSDVYRAFFTASALEKYYDKCDKIISAADEYYEISDEIASRLSDTQNSQGVFCLCRTENHISAEFDSNGRYIMLENVQDPSNLGAISRTAEALGISGLVVCSGCDIFNPKALRASMGSLLRLNIISCPNASDFIRSANDSGMLTLASVPDKTACAITEVPMNGGVVCVVGNEGNGITDETKTACKEKITIPMNGRAESLNAATAAAIIIWEMVRK